jgi:hypothetical protein
VTYVVEGIRDKGKRFGVEAYRNLREEETKGDSDDGSQTVLPRQLKSTMRVILLVYFSMTMPVILTVSVVMRIAVRLSHGKW